MSNSVLKKIVYSLTVKLASPLCISKGDGMLTDNDVLINGEGIPFVPGASLAGAMRGYLEKQKSDKCLFGFENMKTGDGRMSSLMVSDLSFTVQVKTTVRDGVALSEQKTALTGAKFDMEVVDTGAVGHFWMELIIRVNDNENEFLDDVKCVFGAFQRKEIRLGSKKTRGYGEIQLTSVKKKEFTKENALEYKDAYCVPEKQDDTWRLVGLNEMKAESSKYVGISVPLRLDGSISIRQYAAKKNEPDFVHITANGKPVIPGTSFMGAIRHRVKEILLALQASNAEEIIDDIFGYVKAEGSNSKAHISNIVINECVLEGSKKLTMVRNGISRFEFGAKDSALFKEAAYVGGTTTLEIKVKKTDTADETVGLLLLALKDVQNGFLPVGGQTSVGRGVFVPNGEMSITSDLTEEKYLAAAYQALRRE